jgi:DNA anti-recombination protein RmuC
MDNQNNGGINLGELSTIRNILMGQQMAEYEKSFKEVNDTINQKEAEKNQQIKALENRIEERFDNLDKDMKDRFDRLEAFLLENVRQINERISEVSTSDKTNLGQLLAEVSVNLLGKK